MRQPANGFNEFNVNPFQDVILRDIYERGERVFHTNREHEEPVLRATLFFTSPP